MFDTFTKKCTRNYTAAYTIKSTLIQHCDHLKHCILMDCPSGSLYISGDHKLTHLSLLEFPALVNCASPFLFLGMLGGIFHSNFNSTFCKANSGDPDQQYLIWVCIVCLCPTKGR